MLWARVVVGILGLGFTVLLLGNLNQATVMCIHTYIHTVSNLYRVQVQLNRKSLIKTQLRLSLAKHGFVATLRYSHAFVLTSLSLQ